jgi:molybdopterin molybdotransferase
MAQLSQDCFASGAHILTVDEAVREIAAQLRPVDGVETVALADADARVLAEDLVATIQLPPFTNSAVDGYAVRGEDVPRDAARLFRITGRLQAGAAATAPPVAAGEAIRIFTGAPMPEGADTVFMQEDVSLDEADKGRALLPAGLKRGANVRPAGEDIELGRVILPAGRWLRPQDVAAVAAMGLTRIRVRRRPRVAVFSNGDEIVEPGAVRRDTQTFDSNRFMLLAMLRRIGCEVSDLGIRGDDSADIADLLKAAALEHDLILSSGGVSTGEGDYVKTAIESVGTLVFWRIAMKPGRPVAMGVIDGKPFIGLPGNPVASFVTFAKVARPAIFTLAGAQWSSPPTLPVRAQFAYRKKTARREYVRVHLRKAADGTLEAVKFPREGAGLLSSLIDTDGVVELDEDVTRVEAGQVVNCLTYSSLF